MNIADELSTLKQLWDLLQPYTPETRTRMWSFIHLRMIEENVQARFSGDWEGLR
jgi:hypothetical protein